MKYGPCKQCRTDCKCVVPARCWVQQRAAGRTPRSALLLIFLASRPGWLDAAEYDASRATLLTIHLLYIFITQCIKYIYLCTSMLLALWHGRGSSRHHAMRAKLASLIIMMKASSSSFLCDIIR
eukprot:6203521-Pleurochrysis_carterae.AAC.4